MSFTVWYKDNPENPTLFFQDYSNSNNYQIVSWLDYINPAYPYTNFTLPFYTATASVGMGTLMEVNTGISYYALLNVSQNQSLLYNSPTVSSFPNPPSAYFYYLSNFAISLAINLFTYPCPTKMYILCVPYLYLFPSTSTFPSGANATILNLYFQQCYESSLCPLEGMWTLTRIIFNSNNGSNSDSYFQSNVQYFMSNGIISSLFQQFEKSPTCAILPFELVLSLQSKWNYEFPLNLGIPFPVASGE